MSGSVEANTIAAPVAEVRDFLRALAGETRQALFFGVFLDGQEHTVGEAAAAAQASTVQRRVMGTEMYIGP